MKGKRWRGPELVCGALVVAGAAIIGHGDPVSWKCLLTGVAAAMVAALFSFCNDRLVRTHDPRVITFYEMTGACGIMVLTSGAAGISPILPQGWEWLWLLLLSQICTVWAFSVYIGLLRKISVFVISLVSNLEPVYGIILAGILFQEYGKLNGWFLARRGGGAGQCAVLSAAPAPETASCHAAALKLQKPDFPRL